MESAHNTRRIAVIDRNADAAESPSALRVATAAAIGSAMETFDFVLYAFIAAVVFGPLFFSQADPWIGTVAAVATQAVAFVVRPFGSIVFGHFGDKFGRKPALLLSLVLMGLTSTAVGLLPTYATAGVWAPILLVSLRLIQGFAIGGEWAGAVTLSVEHAPDHRRAFYGSFTQLGNMVGIGCAAVMLLVINTIVGPENFRENGWRIPFLLSGVLVVLGLILRSRLDETPEFIAQRNLVPTHHVPGNGLKSLFSTSSRALFGITLMWAAPAAGLYIVLTGMLAYTRVYVPELNALDVQAGLVIGSFVLIAGVFLAAAYAERIGRRRMIIGSGIGTIAWAVPLLVLIDTAVVPLVWLAMAIGALPYALFSAAAPSYMADLFPVSNRYMGVGLSISLGLVLGGGLIPTFGLWWTGNSGGSPIPLMLCLAISGALTIVGVLVTSALPLYRPDAAKNN